MVTRSEIILSWLGLPVYVWQGLRVRRRSIRMPPPEPAPLVEIKGKGTPLNLLIIGDSSAAGVGVTDFKECVAGRLPYLLAEKTGRPVKARTSGNNSATSGHLRDFVVPHLAHDAYDYIILNLGINDSKNFHTASRFKKEFGGLIYALQAKFIGAKIIWSGLIDISQIPLLPSPLNKILGIRSRLLRKKGDALCHERGALSPPSTWQPIAENFAQDGFHASAKGYQEWAEELANYIADLQNQ